VSRAIPRAAGWLWCLLVLACAASAMPEKFYQYYENGLRLMETGDYARALAEFNAAASLEFEDAAKKRTYGTRFIPYYPHLQLGTCYFQLGEADPARRELGLHRDYLPKSLLANRMLDLLARGELPEPRAAEVVLLLEEPVPAEEAPAAVEPPPAAPPAASPSSFSAVDSGVGLLGSSGADSVDDGDGAVAYSTDEVLQVGSRLSIAVLPFELTGRSSLTGERLAEALATKLVNLRRFRVIERSALDRVMAEQALNMSGMVDEGEAVELAKLVGADALVLGTHDSGLGSSRLGVRVIDTETGLTLGAHTSVLKWGALSGADNALERLAIAVYNDLPLLSGCVVEAEGEDVFLDIGGQAGIRRGFKLVVYREGQPIVHPRTGEELGVRVTQLGELVVTQVQDQMAITKPVGKPDQPIRSGDQVITK